MPVLFYSQVRNGRTAVTNVFIITFRICFGPDRSQVNHMELGLIRIDAIYEIPCESSRNSAA
jgi:hypothetical protein